MPGGLCRLAAGDFENALDFNRSAVCPGTDCHAAVTLLNGRDRGLATCASHRLGNRGQQTAGWLRHQTGHLRLGLILGEGPEWGIAFAPIVIQRKRSI